MSKFFVGQRVRIVRTSFRPWLLGAETRIYEFGDYRGQGGGRYSIRLEIRAECGKRVVCSAGHIEPIQPSGAAPSGYSYTELMDRLRAGEVECV